MEIEELIDVLSAFKEGKTIQYGYTQGISRTQSGYATLSYRWEDADCLSTILRCAANGQPLRIKPEPKLRPYKNADEFVKASKEHGEWFRLFDDTRCKYRALSLTNRGVCYMQGHSTTPTFYDYEPFKCNFVWDDDSSPCGVLEEV